MISRNDDPQAANILEQVRIRFGEFKGRSPGRRNVPPPLRRLVLDALDCGIKIGLIARASGISAWTIRSWRKGESPRVRELTIVPEAPAMPTPLLEHRARLVIGRIAIDLPVAAITAGLLREIAGGMP